MLCDAQCTVAWTCLPLCEAPLLTDCHWRNYHSVKHHCGSAIDRLLLSEYRRWNSEVEKPTEGGFLACSNRGSITIQYTKLITPMQWMSVLHTLVHNRSILGSTSPPHPHQDTRQKVPFPPIVLGLPQLNLWLFCVSYNKTVCIAQNACTSK